MTKITMGERMAKVETKLDDVILKVDDHIIEQRKDFVKVFEKLDSLCGAFEKKFAAKWVERVIFYFLTAGSMAVIGWILYIIFK